MCDTCPVDYDHTPDWPEFDLTLPDGWVADERQSMTLMDLELSGGL